MTIDRNYRVLNDGHALRAQIQRDVVTHIPRGATSTLGYCIKQVI